MGLHMVVLVKLHLKLTSHVLGPVMACLPVLKLLVMGLRLFRGEEALYNIRLFLFRSSQIAFNRREPEATLIPRMERALRLIWTTLLPSNTTTQQ
ncbi:putative transmembrane protein [Sesbania bispinosa]|nr:putative transmembrane protein [Sesbania bispinosa]